MTLSPALTKALCCRSPLLHPCALATRWAETTSCRCAPQETRLFNDAKVRDHAGTIRTCRLLMTKVLYMLGQVRLVLPAPRCLAPAS